MPAFYLEIAIVLLGLGLLLADAFATTLDRRVLARVALTGVAVVFGALFLASKGGEPLWGFYAVDAPAFFFKGLALLCTFFVLLMSLDYAPVVESYREGKPGQRGLGEFFCLPLFICAGLMWMASMIDLLGIFVSLETVTVTFYVLVAYLRRNLGSLEAGTKYLILGALSTGFLVYGIAWLFGLTGQTQLQAIGSVIASWEGNPVPLLFAAALLLVGLGFKVGAAPFQLWIPDVYQGAPTPVTALLSIGSKSAGFIVLLRVLEPLLAPASPIRAQLLVVLGIMAAATLLIGNLAALPQGNFKRLLAYSSISHAGFILLALSSGVTNGDLTPSTVTAVYLATYLPMTLVAFFGLTLVRRAGGGEDFASFDGLAQRAPSLALVLLLAAASLAGVPLTAGFIGKFFAFLLAAQAHQWGLLICAVVSAAAGFYYYFKIIRAMYWNAPAADAPAVTVSTPTRWALVVLSISLILLGLYPHPLLAALGW